MSEIIGSGPGCEICGKPTKDYGDPWCSVECEEASVLADHERFPEEFAALGCEECAKALTKAEGGQE